jgi:hypothetical protein
MDESLFEKLFLKLQSCIEAKCPDIRWIDLDLGQLENYEIRPAVSWPCVLIDFNQTSYDQMQNNRQLANLTFTVRLGFDQYSHTANTTPLPVKQKGLKYFRIEQSLYKAIQGFNADDLMQDCTRVNAATERREGDNFRVRVLTFTAMTEDTSAVPTRIKATRPLLEVENPGIELP